MASKAERMLNLIALLMDTARPLTTNQIRDAIYADRTETAFKRMFERDKEELRDLGVPVELAPTGMWESEEGYIVRREDATVPDLGLTPDEQAALWLAAGAWRSDGAARAALKLSLDPRTGSGMAGSWLAPRVDAASPHLGVLLDAIDRRKRVRFSYRTGGGGAAAQRMVEPYALTYRGGWYLAGFDRDRDALRHFKLSRVDGAFVVSSGDAPDFEAPADASAAIPHGPWEGDIEIHARVAFAPRAAWWVERRTGAPRVAEVDDGWIELSIPVAGRDMFVSWILGFADDAVVLEPADLRAEVVAQLERLAG